MSLYWGWLWWLVRTCVSHPQPSHLVALGGGGGVPGGKVVWVDTSFPIWPNEASYS